MDEDLTRQDIMREEIKQLKSLHCYGEYMYEVLQFYKELDDDQTSIHLNLLTLPSFIFPKPSKLEYWKKIANNIDYVC